MFQTNAITAALLSTTIIVGSVGPAFARDLAVVLADNYDRAKASEIWSGLMPILEAAEPGDSFAFYDGPARTRIAGATFPEGDEGALIARFPAMREKLFQPVLGEIRDYLREGVARHEEEPQPALSQVGLIDMLSNLGYVAGEQPEIVFIGSPRLHDPAAAQFSMLDAFPNDAHFALSPSVSPYGTAGMENTLNGSQVHFCSTDTDADHVKRVHRLGVEHVIGMVVQGYGGSLVTFSTDIGSCLTRAATGTADGAGTYAAMPADAPAMIDPGQAVSAVPRLPTAQLDLLRDVAVDDNGRAALRAAMEGGMVTLERVWLSENDQEDGDVATILAAGITIDVALTAQEQEFVVPVTQGKLVVRGTVDGAGGGVTLRLRTENGDQLVSPIMAPGDTIEIAFIAP